MNLHEYQAKELFRRFGIPVPAGEAVATPAQAVAAAGRLAGSGSTTRSGFVWVVKAQVHAGGRGKAGGVKLARSPEEVGQVARAMLGTKLVTKQTGPQGMPVNQVYVEVGSEIERELYLSLLVDRSQQRIAFIASAAGGMDIEEVAATTPEKILTVTINPAAGLQPYQARQIGYGLGLTHEQVKQFNGMAAKLYRLLNDCDASLVEVNPLIVTKAGDLMALDAKINIEDNALFRQPQLQTMRDPSQEDDMERRAAEHDLNYVSLDGNIACMVNGAGLAMATMDLIKAAAFKLILSNPQVKAILVNIFGGIVRCDLIAEGIISAVRDVKVSVPVIVRLEGTNVEKGRAMLHESGLAITPADDLTDAARKAVAALGTATGAAR
ncbi:MAG: ADP-forming succinate--CoA ligase subunit beta [Gammaproteobacteria bacterium PRO9]|nr:ADP-forming succinate--CoA ligase subunit beta [Gammaproteobacteria bacterium PRO9]